MVLDVKCRVCTKRRAVYFRVESGDTLCIQCLKRSIYKKVKRTISSYKMLEPRDEILYLIDPTDLNFSLQAARVFLSLEESFPSKVTLLTPKGLRVDIPGEYETLEYSLDIDGGSNYKVFERRIFEEIVKMLDRVEKPVKLVRALPLEYISLSLIESLYTLDFESLATLTPKYTSSYYTLLNPYCRVSKRELLVLGYLSGWRIVECPYKSKAARFKYSTRMLELLLTHRELLYSTEYSSETISSRLLKRLKQCRTCGLPAFKEYCSVHLKV